MVRILLTIALLFLMSTTATAQQSACPAGRFYSDEQGRCAPPSRWSDLPLNDKQPMRFEVLQTSPEVTWLQATGTITVDTPAEFRRFIATTDAQLSRLLVMHSPGGSLIAAMELGELIRDAGLSTTIGRRIALDGAIMDVHSYGEAYCTSACAYAFLGGVTRSFSGTEEYGLHRFGSASGLSDAEAQIVSSYLAAYLETMGVTQRVLQLASFVPFEGDMLWVPPHVAEELGIVADWSGIAEIVIERINGDNVAMFEVAVRERTLTGMISCDASGIPTIIVSELGAPIPSLLTAANDFRAWFETGPTGRPLYAVVSYIPGSNEAGHGALVFRLPELEAAMVEEGLVLTGIGNPGLPEVSSFETYREDIRWRRAVSTVLFSMKGANAGRTLPIVLDDCVPDRLPKDDVEAARLVAMRIVSVGRASGMSWDAISQRLVSVGLNGPYLADIARQRLGDDSRAKPSFDCQKAISAIELAICGDPRLSRLDGELGATYRARLAANPLGADQLRREQRRWISDRDRACGPDVECLSIATAFRTSVLREMPSASPPDR